MNFQTNNPYKVYYKPQNSNARWKHIIVFSTGEMASIQIAKNLLYYSNELGSKQIDVNVLQFKAILFIDYLNKQMQKVARAKSL